MSILVIGDSFAATDTPRFSNNKDAWANILGKLRKTEVDNFAFGASSLEFSYHMFNRHYDSSKHEIIIFVRTVPFRKFLFVRDTTDERLEKECLVYTINGTSYYDPSLTARDDTRLKYTKIDPEIKKRILKGILAGDLYFPDSQNWKTDAITDSIKLRTKGKTLLTLDMEEQLRPIAMIDYNEYGIKHGKATENDLRPCHMNIQQNQDLAVYISDHLDGKLDINNILKKPTKYFTAAKSLKDTGIVK